MKLVKYCFIFLFLIEFIPIYSHSEQIDKDLLLEEVKTIKPPSTELKEKEKLYETRPVRFDSSIEEVLDETQSGQIGIDVIREDIDGVVFEITFPEPKFSEKQIEGRLYTVVDIPTNNSLLEPGQPNLPYEVIIVAIPHNSQVTLDCSIEEQQIFNSVIPSPTPQIVVNKDPNGLEYPEYIDTIDESIYGGSGIYPNLIAEVESTGVVRGFSIASVAVYPIQYDVEAKKLVFNKKVKVSVGFVGGVLSGDTINKGDISGAEREFIDFFRKVVVNKDTFMTFRYRDNPPTYNSFTVYDLYDDGDVYKLFVKDEGVYKVTYEWLVNHGVCVSGVASDRIRLYTGDHRDLIEESPEFEQPNDSIYEVPLIVFDGGDGMFDEGDYFIFYGFGTFFMDESRQYHKSFYSEYSVYFLTFGVEGKGMRYSDVSLPPDEGIEVQRYYLKKDHREEEKIYAADGCYGNPREGDDWYWTTVGRIGAWEYQFNMADREPGEDLRLRFRLRGKKLTRTETYYHIVKIYINYQNDDHLVFQNNYWYDGEKWESDWKNEEMLEEEVVIPYELLKDENVLIFENFDPTDSEDDIWKSEFWVDWLEFTYWCKLKPYNGKIEFGTYEMEMGFGPVEKIFEIGPFESSELIAIDRITNRNISGEIEERDDGFYLRFKDELFQPAKIYEIYQDNAFSSVVDVIRDQPSNLHDVSNGADGIYVTYDYYYDIIEPLAEVHRHEGYDVMVVKAEDVYEEFGKGQLDPTAIRNMLYHAYHFWEKRPTFVTLVGFCTKDPMDHWGRQKDVGRLYLHHGMNKMHPHYEFHTSYRKVPSDIWFTCLEGRDPVKFTPDMAISRISAYDREYTSWVVNKSIDYSTSPDYGDWKISTTLVADNGFTFEGPGDFPEDMEELIEYVMPYGFIHKKIYMDRLKHYEEYDPSWENKDGLEKRTDLARKYLTPEIYRNFNSLILIFSGHGSFNVWCHEKLFYDWIVHPDNPFQEWMQPAYSDEYGEYFPHDVYELLNYHQFPHVMQLSCNLGHFDLEVAVMSEKLPYIKDKGAVMTDGEDRLGYENEQNSFNNNIWSYIFDSKMIPFNKVHFSMAYWMAKIEANKSVQMQHNLMGDCMLYFGCPTRLIRLDSYPPRHKRGSILEIDGAIENEESFNGYAIVQIADSPFYCEYEGEYPIIYRDRILTKTRVRVENGDFHAELPIPYETGDGDEPTEVKLFIYAYDENRGLEAMLNEDVRIDIEDYSSSSDTQGPLITVKAGSQNFMDGDYVPKKCPVWIDLKDDSGILLADSDITSAISLEVTGEDGYEVDVTRLFEPEVDDYTRGSIHCYVDIPEGEHQIRVTASDIFGNESTSSIDVRTSSGLSLTDVMNCPNPMVDETNFTFNASKDIDELKIMVFTSSGRLIKTIEERYLNAGYNEIHWDGDDFNGNRLANGVYLYKIIARTGDEKYEAYDKLIVMR
ncbi:MAG: hypothetical protein DRH49_02780 [Candidatus Coatesbacteria bacterium]|nr:MAG: hypothetical protein DRH49_02780 [Candidatus Coatesbacteria bacterium]